MTGTGEATGKGKAIETRWAQVDGRAVRVLECGSGPPVVLVHGLGLSAGEWAPHLPRIAAAGYRVLAPDLPGFGQSPGPSAGLSIAAAAAWLLRLADVLHLERAAWVGHSLGAQQIARLAAMAPERAAALVLAAPTGRTGWHPLHQLRGLVTTAFQERPLLVAGVIRRYLLAPITTVVSWVRSMRHDLALEAPRVSCPALVVMGERDAVVPDRFVARLERLLPDVETRAIQGATHAVALAPVGPFTEAVIGFLARRYSPGASS